MWIGENDRVREDASTLRSRATAEDGHPPGWGTRKPKGECGQPTFMKAERAVEWENVRLCSLDRKKNVERKPDGKRPEATEDTAVTEDAGFGEKHGDCEDALPPGLGNRPIQGAVRGHRRHQGRQKEECRIQSEVVSCARPQQEDCKMHDRRITGDQD